MKISFHFCQYLYVLFILVHLPSASRMMSSNCGDYWFNNSASTRLRWLTWIFPPAINFLGPWSRRIKSYSQQIHKHLDVLTICHRTAAFQLSTYIQGILKVVHWVIGRKCIIEFCCLYFTAHFKLSLWVLYNNNNS